MWNLNNEYNTPLAQMNRLKMAGLNPDLMYQQGNPGNSMAQAQAQERIPQQAYTGDFASGLNSAFETGIQKRLADAQIDNINAQTDKVKAETDLTNKNVYWIDKLNTEEINQIKQSINQMASVIDVNTQSIKN